MCLPHCDYYIFVSNIHYFGHYVFEGYCLTSSNDSDKVPAYVETGLLYSESYYVEIP